MTLAASTSVPARPFGKVRNRLVVGYLQFAALCWAGFVLSVFVTTAIVSLFRPIEISGMAMGMQAVQWFALVVCVHIGWQELELHVTHGQSRQGFLKAAFAFIVIWSAAIAGLFTIGFVPEALLYWVTGWSQAIPNERLAANALELHMLFIESWLVFAAWSAGGLMLGVAWYRSTVIGALMIPVALLIGALTGLTHGNSEGPLAFLVREGIVPAEPHLAMALPVHVAAVLAFFVLTWVFGRDVPIRKKAA